MSAIPPRPVASSHSALYPCSGAHAVQSVAFVIEWPQPLQAEDVARIYGKHGELARALPIAQPGRSLTLNFSTGTGFPDQPLSTEGVGSVLFARQGYSPVPGPFARSLEVTRQSALAVVNDYTRWAAVWAEVREWLGKLGPVFMDRRSVLAVGLQYTDLFHWRDDPNKLTADLVFDRDTIYLPKNAFQVPGLWHSHHGYFEEMAQPRAHRLLENLNVNLIENLGQRSIQIVSAHRAMMDEKSPIWGWEQLEAHLDGFMEHLHARNKQVLRLLLSAETRALIKLDT